MKEFERNTNSWKKWILKNSEYLLLSALAPRRFKCVFILDEGNFFSSRLVVWLRWNGVTFFEQNQSPAQFQLGLCWFPVNLDTNQNLHHLRLRSSIRLLLLCCWFYPLVPLEILTPDLKVHCNLHEEM